MKRYNVTIMVSNYEMYEVEADSEDEAEGLALDMVAAAEAVLIECEELK